MRGLDLRIHRDAEPWMAGSSPAMTPMRYPFCALALVALMAVPGVASSQEDAFCRDLAVAVADGKNKFRSLRGQRFDNTLESFEANLRLPQLETCRVDAIAPGYFCMSRGLDRQAGDDLAGELVQRVHSCYPHARATQQPDPKSPVARTVTEWTLDGGRTIRVVRRVYSEKPGSVYLYVR
jgi:hypothetical protein